MESFFYFLPNESYNFVDDFSDTKESNEFEIQNMEEELELTVIKRSVMVFLKPSTRVKFFKYLSIYDFYFN